MAAPRPVHHASGSSSAHGMQSGDQPVSFTPDILKMLRDAITQAGKASGQHIVALIGNTGVGKSTAINDLTGHQITYGRDGQGSRILKVAEGEGIAKIGHRAATSETLYTHVHTQSPLRTEPPLVLADAGGFLESRGVDKEIAAATSLKLTLENARTVRLVLCYEAGNILTDRGVHFAQFVRTALRQLMQAYQSRPRSTMLMLTKPPAFANNQYPDEGRYTLETAIQHLRKLQHDLGEGSELRQIYDYILREQGRYVAVYSPVVQGAEDRTLRQQTKDHVLRLMGELEGINDPRGFFHLPYSPQVKLRLVEVMSGIAFMGAQRYKSFFDHESQIKTRKEELRSLEMRKAEIDRALETLGGGVSDPDIINESIAAIVGAQDAIIEDQQKNITESEEETQKVQAKIREIEQKVISLDQAGEREEAYWKDSIDQKGINIESVTRSTHSRNKKITATFIPEFIGGYSSSHNHETITTTSDKRPIERDFQYRGPTIARIELTPSREMQTSGRSYWSNFSPENPKGADHFSVHYQTGNGEDARATVTVFVLKKDLPLSILEKSQYVQEKGDLVQKLKELSDQKGEHQQLIAQAEKTKSIKGGTKERVAQYQESLNQLMREIQRVGGLITSLAEQNETTRVAIVADSENSAFLRDYLRLSGDRELADRENIREFLELDERFRRASSIQDDEKRVEANDQ